jgi:3-oxoacyl-[acyl-carrier-protein] synthase II
MNRRVVITGLGVVSPIGIGINEFWKNVKNGKCGIGEITQFDTENFKVKMAAEVKDFQPESYFDRKEAKRMARYTQLGMAAAIQAVEDSKIQGVVDPERFGTYMGSGIGGIEIFENESKKLLEKGPDRISVFFIPMMIPNMLSGQIAIKFGAKGICSCTVVACATGTYCIGDAYRHIKQGGADVIIAGASEATISPLAIAGFTNMTALSTKTDPNRCSIPFDKERDGFVMGEGAGALILESYEHAIKRGAKIYGEIVGYGTTCDAYHITAPDSDGNGAARAMQMAAEEAGIKPSQISYINAHGTSTPANDLTETLAIKKLLGDDAEKVPISSTKSMTGHLLGTAGAVEAIVCIKALEEGFIPATINYKVPDEQLNLDYVPNIGRKQELEYAMSNSLGFGGHNGSLIFKKFRG